MDLGAVHDFYDVEGPQQIRELHKCGGGLNYLLSMGFNFRRVTPLPRTEFRVYNSVGGCCQLSIRIPD